MSATILALIAACSGGGLATAIQWIANRGKASAEEVEIWTRSSVARLQRMHEEMTLLENRLRELNVELEQERTTRMNCASQLREATQLLAANGLSLDA